MHLGVPRRESMINRLTVWKLTGSRSEQGMRKSLFFN
jgi:hypothetical protein